MFFAPYGYTTEHICYCAYKTNVDTYLFYCMMESLLKNKTKKQVLAGI